MKTTAVLISLLILSLCAGSAFSNGLSFNSIGPKSLGSGGAFVGLANDYTAMYWNPAGMTQMEKNFIGVFATDIIPIASYKLPAAGIDAQSNTIHYIAPNIMGGYHFNISDKLTFGLGVYVPAGLGTEWNGDDLKNLTGGSASLWRSKIYLIDIAPAVAYKFSDQFSAGLAFNMFRGSFELDKPDGHGFNYSESSSGWGYGVTLGVLYKPVKQFSVGASFRSRAWVKMSGSATDPLFEQAFGAPITSNFDRTMGWPMWIAGGIAYRPTDNLVLTADVQFSQWSGSEDKFTAVYNDPTWNGVLKSSGGNLMVLRWQDATQIRFGGDYSLDENWDLRAGYYYDPAPAPDATLNILFPSISYSAATIGAGYKIDSYVIDGALEYLFGTDREIAPGLSSYSMPGTHGMHITAFSLGAGYEF